MNDQIKTNREITVPHRLVAVLEQLVSDYAKSHGEQPADCRRAVEIAVMHFGTRALREELDANRAMGVAMGWAKEEETT